MTRIIFVRHGETLWNKEGRYQGQLDSPLSPLGQVQAEKVGQFLQNRRIDVVYSSDLKRARVTAEVIGSYHNLTPLIDSRLREMSFGLWEGKTRDQVRLEYPELVKARQKDRTKTRIPGSELPHEVVERFEDFLQDFLERASQQTSVIVSHGGALRLIIAQLLSIPLEKSICIHQGNTGISELVYSRKGSNCLWEAICINSTGHLG